MMSQKKKKLIARIFTIALVVVLTVILAFSGIIPLFFSQ